MWQIASDGLTYLTSQSGDSLLHLFWFVALFEIPRYLFAFLAVAALSIRTSTKSSPLPPNIGRVTVVIAGHNEQDSIERCVHSVYEQSLAPDEIIVISDGSTDRMPEKLRELQELGLIREGHCTQLRAGKSAGFNLALGRATGDIIVNVDCDCTFDRHAIKEIVAVFADPRVGGVAGNIVPRNPRAA